jgi:lipopolysaccharide transport system ATP-binding protein
MAPIIKVENLSKQYRLGQVGTGTMSDDVKRWWYRVRGKEDPFLKIGEVNDRTASAASEYVWALKDINFEVQPGEVLGIIGRNGAGKSTLLKILSRVTEPTTGRVRINGRVASLLEVGTGFHPDLTGRENIFLNGAILGMSRKEISSKFDEIVDFAGVERYIDTPVKRYSSGMHVRLGFAVAAHLDPEILIVDEVLAVGDAEFQKKCLGKMKDVSINEGRTVLFVSHNLNSISVLAKRAIVLEKGTINFDGNSTNAIHKYF